MQTNAGHFTDIVNGHRATDRDDADDAGVDADADADQTHADMHL